MFRYYFGIAFINLVVILVVVASFIIGGSPSELKDIGYDTTRTSAFQQINLAVQSSYATKQVLPNSLNGLETLASIPKDPQTSLDYTYEKVSDTQYKLCTTFSTDSELVKQKNPSVYSYGNDRNNKHKKGYDCITYDVPSIPNPVTNQTNQSAQITQTLVWQIENQSLFTRKDAEIDANPKDSVNITSGFTSSGNLKLLISPSLSSIYEIKNNNSDYLVSLEANVTYDGNFQDFKNKCGPNKTNNTTGCYMSLESLDFVSSTGASYKKNSEGTSNYVTSGNEQNIQKDALIDDSILHNIYGRLFFYVPKQDFYNEGKPTKILIKNFNQGNDVIAHPKDIELSITVK